MLGSLKDLETVEVVGITVELSGPLVSDFEDDSVVMDIELKTCEPLVELGNSVYVSGERVRDPMVGLVSCTGIELSVTDREADEFNAELVSLEDLVPSLESPAVWVLMLVSDKITTREFESLLTVPSEMAIVDIGNNVEEFVDIGNCELGAVTLCNELSVQMKDTRERIASLLDDRAFIWLARACAGVFMLETEPSSGVEPEYVLEYHCKTAVLCSDVFDML